MDSEYLKRKMLARERVANVRKHWVRLVTACNSRCVFCLDTDTPRNVYISEEDVHRELIRGREQLHADKVILSGGEGSIHPKFPHDQGDVKYHQGASGIRETADGREVAQARHSCR